MYTIQTEGRKLSDIMVKGNIIRIDTKDLSLVSELKGWIYKELPGHGDIHYIELVDQKPKAAKKMKKRFVLKTSKQVGIESDYDYENDKYYVFWFVWDKLNNKLVDCIDESAGEGGRDFVKRQADRLNEEWIEGALNESDLFDE